MPTEVRRQPGHRETGQSQRDTSALVARPDCPRRGIQSERQDVEAPVHEGHTTGSRADAGVLGHAGERRGRRRGHSGSDQAPGGAGRPRPADEIEQRRGGPEADGQVGEEGVGGVPDGLTRHEAPPRARATEVSGDGGESVGRCVERCAALHQSLDETDRGARRGRSRGWVHAEPLPPRVVLERCGVRR